MSLVGRVGRKRPRARIAMAVLYLLLILGAVTTLYPFLLMVSTSLKGPTDQNSTRIVPAYFQEEKELLDKYVDDKYAGDKSLIAATRGASAESVEQYDRFLKALPIDDWQAGFQ